MVSSNALLQVLGSLIWRMQEDRNLFNQYFKAEPAWSIGSGHRTSGPGAFSNFDSWRALANFSWDTFVRRCWNPPKLWHLFNDKSGWLAVCCFEYSIFNQLRSNRVGGGGTEAACVTGISRQVINHIPWQPSGVREINVIHSLRPAIFCFSSRWESKVEAAELVVLPCPAHRKTW